MVKMEVSNANPSVTHYINLCYMKISILNWNKFKGFVLGIPKNCPFDGNMGKHYLKAFEAKWIGRCMSFTATF